MRLALATCAELPPHEADDLPLHAALAAHGICLEQPVWNDPTADWSGFDGVLIRTTWDYTAHAEAFRTWADHVALVSRLENPASVVRWNTDKSYLQDLEQLGVPTLQTHWLAPGELRLGGVTAGLQAEEGFLKPRVGATAEGTLRFRLTAEGIAQAEEHLAREARTCGYLLQPFLPTVLNQGECSAIVIGGEISHGVRKVPVPGDYRVQDDFGAHDEPHPLSTAERNLALSAMVAAERATGSNLLYGRVDWLTEPDGTPRLIELELVEPSLFFRHGPGAAERLLDAWLKHLGG